MPRRCETARANARAALERPTSSQSATPSCDAGKLPLAARQRSTLQSHERIASKGANGWALEGAGRKSALYSATLQNSASNVHRTACIADAHRLNQFIRDSPGHLVVSSAPGKTCAAHMHVSLVLPGLILNQQPRSSYAAASDISGLLDEDILLAMPWDRQAGQYDISRASMVSSPLRSSRARLISRSIARTIA